MGNGSLWVASYPQFEPSDLSKIELFRQENDRLYFGVVQPHFTLVFPEFDRSVAREEYVDHVRRMLGRFEAFDVELTDAALERDHFKPYWHVFLVPDARSEGYRRLAELHDALYEGPLQPLLRSDIPYLPHIGIANSADRELCERLCLRARDLLPIHSRIHEVELGWYDHEKNQRLEKIALGARR